MDPGLSRPVVILCALLFAALLCTAGIAAIGNGVLGEANFGA